LAIAAATLLSCGRPEVIGSNVIPLPRSSVAAVQARAQTALVARGYAVYPPDEQMRRLVTYDLPLRKGYESVLVAERELGELCASASPGCRGIGVVMVYVFHDDVASLTGWDVIVRGYATRRPSALERFSPVPVTKDVQADVAAIAELLQEAPPPPIAIR
jgi:hypothetical protein